MREHDLERQQAAAAPARARTPAPVAPQSAVARALAAGQHVPAGGRSVVARSIVDDIQQWWSGPEEGKKVERKEVPITAHDFNQILSLVAMPISSAQVEISGAPDVARAKAATAKLAPAVGALHTIANTKREAKNRDNLYRPSGDIQAAWATLRVMAEADNAPAVWKDQFERAMQSIDEVPAAPVKAEDPAPAPAPAAGAAAPAAPAGGDPDALTQRDHDLISTSLKPMLQNLITTTSGKPYADFDPKSVASDGGMAAAFSAFTSRKLLTAKQRVQNGLQAIKAFDMSMIDQKNEAMAKMEAAQVGIGQAMASYSESDPTDPASPSYMPPEPAP